MTFSELLEAQWSDYPERHRHRTNLLIHIVAVPAVWWAAIQGLGALFLMLLGVPGAFAMLFWSAVLAAVALFVQVRGDALEARPPEPLGAAPEAAKKLVAEQFVTFPRFVLTGGWLANLKAP
jgi:hypothetical protein